MSLDWEMGEQGEHEQEEGKMPVPPKKDLKLPEPKGEKPSLEGFISYEEMYELKQNIGELLHRMVDSCILFIAPDHDKDCN